jgi:hypothetical protein
VPVAATSIFWPPLEIARAFTGFGVYAVKVGYHSQISIKSPDEYDETITTRK